MLKVIEGKILLLYWWIIFSVDTNHKKQEKESRERKKYTYN